MTPQEMQQIRQALGLSLSQWAEMLGYEGAHARTQAFDLETGRRPIRDPQRRLAEAYRDGYRPRDWPSDPKFAQETD